jgi:hypothetical protein
MKYRVPWTGLTWTAWFLFSACPLLATNRTVTNLNDSGVGSLRDTIAASADGDSINFSVTGTITLTSTELAIAHNITINGPGANVLSVSSNRSGFYRIFNITSGTVSISGLTISNGQVQFTNTSIGGGGIRNGGTLTLNNCVIDSNQATGGGFLPGVAGGIWNDTSGTLTMVNCTISNNAAGAASNALGGGIYNTGTLTMTNSTVSGNAIGAGGEFGGQVSGGGISNSSNGTLSMLNCTVSNNSATANAGPGSPGTATGGGIYQSSSINPSLRNTIIAANNVSAPGLGGNATDPDVFGIFSSQGHNLIGNTGDSSGWIASDKLDANATPLNLGPLQNAGGPTQTMPLLAGSVAIDAGDDAFAPKLDQRGDVRSGLSDMGAFEFDGAPLRITSIVRLTNGHAILQCLGVPNQVNDLQLSPDLSPGSFGTIMPVPNSADTAGAFQYDDSGAVGLTKRFYRLAFP